jgi:uncharacterized membrane protein YdjX (TVP38/TMEM64 family)
MVSIVSIDLDIGLDKLQREFLWVVIIILLITLRGNDRFSYITYYMTLTWYVLFLMTWLDKLPYILNYAWINIS